MGIVLPGGKKGLFMQLQFPWQKYSSIDCIIGGKDDSLFMEEGELARMGEGG